VCERERERERERGEREREKRERERRERERDITNSSHHELVRAATTCSCVLDQC
jgi:hypothetical protein